MTTPSDYVYASTSGLEITDGTVTGTTVIDPASSSFSPDVWMGLLGSTDEVIFGASDGGTGTLGATDQLWMTDGTTGGTHLVTTLPTQATATSDTNHEYGITNVVSFGSGVLFTYSTGAAPVAGLPASALYYSNGTATGTIALPDSQGAFASPYAVLDGKMLFTSTSGLVETDGTVAGTTIVKAANTANGGFVTGSAVVALGNGQAMFLASAGASTNSGGTNPTNQVWITNGTGSGTTLVTTLPDNTPKGQGYDLSGAIVAGVVNGKLLFSYDDGGTSSQYSLYVSDGTKTGTFALPDGAGAFGGTAAPGGKFVFVSSSGICVTDGTAAGTSVLKAASSTFSPVGNFSTMSNGDVLFSAGPSGDSNNTLPTGNTQLWMTDGTAAGTTLVETLPDDSSSKTSDSAFLTPVGSLTSGYLLDYGTGGTGPAAGANLYGSTGTVASTVELPNSASPGISDYDTAFLPCFARGTLIETARGVVAVEALGIGDHVKTGSGNYQKIIWLGHRGVDCRRHPDPARIRPVRIAADAFAPGIPARDLVLSPDHAVFQDNVLIPVKHLINGGSIAQVTVDKVEYWHVELARHDILLAEGLTAESYLDTGNRSAFANGGNEAQLHPDFTAKNWSQACAELVQDGPILAAVKQRLFERAATTHGRPALALRVLADGSELPPDVLAPGIWRYVLPRDAGTLRLVSPSWSPAACVANSLDRRRLGVRLFGLAIDGRALPLDAPAMRSGFHQPEITAEGPCRWTDGDASLALPPGSGAVVLRIGDDAAPAFERAA